MAKDHFDSQALLSAVQEQPVGLLVSTNHPAGFKRLMYLAMRRSPALKCQILQSPHSASAFMLVKASLAVEGAPRGE